MNLIGVEELAKMLGKSPAAVRRMRERGELPPAIVLGKRSVRWAEADIAAWLADQREQANAAPIRRRTGRPARYVADQRWRVQ